MATLLTPDCTYTLNGVPVRVKLIPDWAKWNNAAKAKAAKSYAGAPYKHGGLICGTGKPASVTIHNTVIAGSSAETIFPAGWARIGPLIPVAPSRIPSDIPTKQRFVTIFRTICFGETA